VITLVAKSGFDESLTREDSGRTRYLLGMARTKRAQDEDLISRLADTGEDALRRLVGFPRRVVVDVMDGVGERLQDAATKLRGIDPLVGRVAALEKRLDSLEKPKKRTARKASSRAKPSTSNRASTAVALAEPEQAEPDRGRRDENRAQDEWEQGQAPGLSESAGAS
jgi:hypothetical protein